MKKIMLLVGLLVLISTCTIMSNNAINESNSHIEFKDLNASNQFLNNTHGKFSLKSIRDYLIDYSKTAYIQVTPENDSRFVYFECINSTLKIDNNMIYCES